MTPSPPLTGRPLLEADDVVDSRYAIRRLIGEGGFAEVYEARHVHIDRRVALKVLTLDPRLHAELDARFMTEARLAARLDHPNVVKIYDFGFVDSPRLPYIAMEFLDGRDVADELLQFGPMSPRRAERVVRQALQALASAHEQGIVHKDLKPSNLFIQHAGRSTETIKLVDFGIAGLQASNEQRRTATGELCGTPAYLAPEYIEGAAPTPAMDVYQMALILVELLTGQPVVDGATPYAVLMRHCSGDLTIPVGLLTSGIGPVLRRALRRDPAERYPDAGAFLAALDSSAGGFVALEGMMSGADWPAAASSSSAGERAHTDEVSSSGPTLAASTAHALLDDEDDVTERIDDDAPAHEAAPVEALDAPHEPVRIRAEVLTTETELEPRPRPGTRRTMALVAVVVVLAMVIGIAYWSSVSASRSQATAEAAVDTTPETAAVASPRGEAPRLEPTATPTPTEVAAPTVTELAAEPAPTPVEVTITSQPEGSDVLIDGTVLGVTPLTLAFDDGSKPVWLELRHEGHISASVELVPDARPHIAVVLQSSQPAPPPLEPRESSPRKPPVKKPSESRPAADDSPPRFIVID